MFGSIGITELVLILVIVMIIFGAGKLPQLGEGLGKAIKGFKKSVHEADAIEAEAQAQAQAQAQIASAPQGQPAQSGTAAAPAVPTVDGKPITPPPPPSQT
jgi:sec-independent protein translocase protein TatA